MTKPVNLNRIRKERQRAEEKARADQNAAFHGLTKDQKEAARREGASSKDHLDAHLRTPPTAPKSPK